jgi:hypothetical protein
MTYTPDISKSSAAQSFAYQDIRQDLASILEEIDIPREWLRPDIAERSSGVIADIFETTPAAESAHMKALRSDLEKVAEAIMSTYDLTRYNDDPRKYDGDEVAVKHFAPYGASTAIDGTPVPSPAAWDQDRGEYAEIEPLTVSRSATSCVECLQILLARTEEGGTGD